MSLKELILDRIENKKNFDVWTPSEFLDLSNRDAIDKAALDPHQSTTIRPYIAEEMLSRNFDVTNLITINADRTFWDKIIILHGIRGTVHKCQT